MLGCIEALHVVVRGGTIPHAAIGSHDLLLRVSEFRVWDGLFPSGFGFGVGTPLYFQAT